MNFPPRATMNMHRFAIPLPRPLAPGQNVTIRFVQTGPPDVRGPHPHFHFVMDGQASSPVLQGPTEQEGKAKARTKLNPPIIMYSPSRLTYKVTSEVH